MSAIIPVSELTQDAIRNMKLKARRMLVELMVRAGKVQAPSQVAMRDIRANDDLTIANGADTNEFLTAAMVAGTNLTYVNALLAANRYLAIFAVAVDSTLPAPITMLFQVGPGGTTTRAYVDLQKLYVHEQFLGYLDDPVVYQPSDPMFIAMEIGRTDAAGQRVILIGYVAEPMGHSIS